jgi:diphthamide biosynthesis protein 2
MADLLYRPAEHAFEHDEINEALAGPSTMGDATEEMGVEEAFEVEDTIRRIREGSHKTVSQTFDRGAIQKQDEKI